MFRILPDKLQEALNRFIQSFDNVQKITDEILQIISEFPNYPESVASETFYHKICDLGDDIRQSRTLVQTCADDLQNACERIKNIDYDPSIEIRRSLYRRRLNNMIY